MTRLDPSPSCLSAVLLAVALAVGCAGKPSSPPGTPPPTGTADAGTVIPGVDGGVGQPPPPVGSQDYTSRFPELVEQFRSDLAANDVPGGAIAIVSHGDVILAEGVGVRRQGASDPVTADTLFQIASVTKMLTALTGLTLAEAGTLGLDDAFNTHVPFVNTSAPYTESFTVADILRHRSGYPTEIPGGNYQNAELEGFFQNNSSVQLWAPRGVVFNYSNEGYALAGLGLQRASGTPFAQLVEQRVFAPLGMTRSTLQISRVEADDDVSFGHSTDGGGPLGPRDSYYHQPWYGPMGGAWSSARELAMVARVLVNRGQGLLQPQTFERMIARPEAALPDQGYCGMGVFVRNYQNGTLLTHSGSVGGFLTNVEAVPEAGFAMVTMVNSDAYFPSDVHDRALEEVVGLQYPPYEPWEPSSAELQSFAGTYQDQVVLGTVQVTVSGSSLSANLGNLGQTVELIPWATDSFYFVGQEGYEEDVMFVRDATGQPKYFASGLGVAER